MQDGCRSTIRLWMDGKALPRVPSSGGCVISIRNCWVDSARSGLLRMHRTGADAGNRHSFDQPQVPVGAGASPTLLRQAEQWHRYVSAPALDDEGGGERVKCAGLRRGVGSAPGAASGWSVRDCAEGWEARAGRGAGGVRGPAEGGEPGAERWSVRAGGGERAEAVGAGKPGDRTRLFG